MEGVARWCSAYAMRFVLNKLCNLVVLVATFRILLWRSTSHQSGHCPWFIRDFARFCREIPTRPAASSCAPATLACPRCESGSTAVHGAVSCAVARLQPTPTSRLGGVKDRLKHVKTHHQPWNDHQQMGVQYQGTWIKTQGIASWWFSKILTECLLSAFRGSHKLVLTNPRSIHACVASKGWCAWTIRGCLLGTPKRVTHQLKLVLPLVKGYVTIQNCWRLLTVLHREGQWHGRSGVPL